MKLLILILFSTFLSINGQNVRKLEDRSLLRRNSSIIVTFSESLDTVYGELSSKTYRNKATKLRAISRGLKTITRRWHQPALRELRRLRLETKSFWLTNQIFVRNASPQIISYLLEIPSVKSIEEEKIFVLEEPSDSWIVAEPPNGTEWHVERIGAEELWGKNITGEGIRIAIIDTGVRATHEALREGFVGIENNGWFDATDGYLDPEDNVGHGTHCAAIATGRTGTGVAKGAQWMACRACDYFDGSGRARCPQSALLACGEWTVCPTDPEGNNEDCSKSPHIVSNSWGIGQNNEFFNQIIRTWNDNNIIPVFSVGNSGDRCFTAASPADQPGVISVGATDINDTVSEFSSRGPAPGGAIAPSIVAPGENILSAFINSDDSYELMSGTSMSCPAVAGAIALLKQQDPDLTMQEALDLLLPTTDRDLGGDLRQCNPGSNEDWPNNVAGYGRVHVGKAFEMMEGRR